MQARGQPNFQGGEGAKKLKKMVRQLWWESREQEVRRRIGRGVSGGKAKQRTLHKRKGLKVVPVDEAHGEGIKPAGGRKISRRACHQTKFKALKK